MVAFINIFWLYINTQTHIATATRLKLIFDMRQFAGHQGKQIGWLGKGVVPGDIVATGIIGTRFKQIAITLQYRVSRPVCVNSNSKHRHNVGPIQVVGDFAKALGLTLGTEHRA